MLLTDICGIFVGPATTGQEVVVECDGGMMSGQFVIVQMRESSPQRLQINEMKVCGDVGNAINDFANKLDHMIALNFAFFLEGYIPPTTTTTTSEYLRVAKYSIRV